MPIDLDERGNALENEYFHRQEKELLEKMKAKLEAENAQEVSAKCPKKECACDMKEVDFENVKIDICDKCGGVWLDGGELAQLMNKEGNKGGWFNRLFK
jgi:ribosomal protein L37AE/L43A